jgi:cytochrome c
MIATGITLIYAFYWTWKTLTGEQAQILQFFTKIVFSIVVFFFLYGGNRQLYRHNALAPHQKLMAAKTKEFQKLSEEARLHPVVEVEVADTSEFGKGKDLFTKNCSSCHKEKEKLVGPPMTEMVSIYENNPEGLKKWINSPGKKRPDYPQMPSFGSLSDEDLNELTKYILSIKK